MLLGKGGVPGARECLACLVALVLAAATAALINGVLEAETDIRMARLQRRVASLERIGAIRATGAAVGMLAVALALCAAFLPTLTAILLLSAVLAYAPLYTLCFKRRSPWGVMPGGIPGALPVLIGASAAGGGITGAPLLLFLVMLLWQPPHFWALALLHQDDYRQGGIPVLPLVRGEAYTKRCALLFIAMLLPAATALWFTGACSGRFALFSLCLGLSYLFGSYLCLVKGRFRLAVLLSILYLVGLLSGIVIDICGRISPLP